MGFGILFNMVQTATIFLFISVCKAVSHTLGYRKPNTWEFKDTEKTPFVLIFCWKTWKNYKWLEVLFINRLF